MTLAELKERAPAELRSGLFIREEVLDGKPVVKVGVVIPATERTKRWEKALVFAASNIPDNAIEKIARVIA